MRYKNLGRSGLKVSEACLGTMNFGTAGGVASCGEAEAARIVGAFLDAGHNLVDTADAYTGGDSERFVGRAIRGRRESVVLATKAFLPQGPGPNDAGLSRAHLVKALDGSLRRLGTDYVDLYQCHQWDEATPIEETMATLDGFVRAGKVRYLGCSNFTAAQIVEARWAAQRLDATPFVSLQPQYSLLQRAVEPEILPTCQRHGLGVIAWSPLGGGVLAGRYRRGVAPDADTRIGRLGASPSPMARAWAGDLLNDRNLDIADEVTKVAAELGASPAAVAIAWLRRRPGVTSVIVGPPHRRPARRQPGRVRSRPTTGGGRPPGRAVLVAGPRAGQRHGRPPVTGAEAERLVARYFEMWNTGDRSIAEEILAPDWVDHAHPEVGGPPDVARVVERVRAARPGLRFQIDATLGDGPLVAAVGRVDRVGGGPADGDPPAELIWLIRTHGGRMAEMWTYRAADRPTAGRAGP